MTIPGADRVIVALDFPSATGALKLVDQLAGTGCAFKVGLELFSAEGPALVQSLRERGVQIFVDLKLHDIPNTVAGAARSLARHGAWLVTVHVAGGEEMCRAAVEAATLEAEAHGLPRPKILGITVLTSFSEASFAEAAGVATSIAAETARRAEKAMAWGLDGVVTSPLEASRLREVLGPGPLLVTPGVRPGSSDRADQVRVATPGAAIAAGADYLVIGRPIYRASDPRAALEAIALEVQKSIGSN